MNYLFLSLALFICKDGIGQQITWDNFKGAVPDSEQFVAARTYTGMKLDQDTDETGRVHCVVTPMFFEDQSWVRHKTNEGLAHERVHWMICVYYAKLCQRSLNKMNIQSIDGQRFLEIYIRYADDMNETFDRRTQHGQNKDREEEWESIISAQLKQLQ